MNVIHTNFKLEIWRGLTIKEGSRELLWPTLIGLFSELTPQKSVV